MTLEEVDPSLWALLVAAGTWPSGARVQDQYGAVWVTLAGGAPGAWVTLDSLSEVTNSGTSGTAEVILRMTSDLTLTPGGFGTDLMKWGGMFDPITFDPITEIPADLGMTFTFDDTSADITTTVDGVWAYAMRVGGTADDTCGLLVGLLGYDVVDIYEPDMTADSWGIYPPVLNLASTLKLPAGTTFQFFMRMFKDATATPYVISGGPYLKLTRIA